MKKLLAVLFVCIFLLACSSPKIGNRITKMGDVFEGGRLIQCYQSSSLWGPDKFVFVILKSDSVIVEKEVSVGVYYSYFKILKHQGYVSVL